MINAKNISTLNKYDAAKYPSGRIQELDGLRGIAILLVVSFHYLNNQLLEAQSKLGRLLCKATSFGWIGVDLFFVLSGFLIGTILYKNKGSQNYFSTFYIRRILRIIPNYFLLIVIFLILLSIPFFSEDYFLTGNNVMPVWSYFFMVHNLFMASYNNLGNSAMSVTWSIGIEEQFYIIFPLIVFYCKRRILPFLLFATILLAVIFRMQYSTWIPAYVSLHCRMDAIAFGALVAYFNFFYDLKKWVNRNWGKLLFVFLGNILICLFLYYRYQDLGTLRNTFLGIFFSLLLVFALTKQHSLLAVFLRNRLLVWVGSISYSLYLFHYMVLGIFHHFMGTGIEIKDMTDVLLTIIAFAASLAIATVLYKKLETPMAKIGARYTY